jgi:glyoxylase-like metal-dependent hydrolase (beta-lactamase superfamily II)
MCRPQGVLSWVANSATLIWRAGRGAGGYLPHREQSNGLADAIVASGKTLKAIYVTHAHGDHFFGIKVLRIDFRVGSTGFAVVPE